MYNLSFMRYVRLDQIIRSDRALAMRLSKRTVWIGKPNQEGEYFAPEIVGIAEELSKHADIGYIPRAQIINFACDVLVLKTKKLNLKDLKASKPVPMKKEHIFDVGALLDERLEETLKSIQEAENLLSSLRKQAGDLQRAKAALQPGAMGNQIRERLKKIAQQNESDPIAEQNGAESEEQFAQKKPEEAEEPAEPEMLLEEEEEPEGASFQGSVNEVAEELVFRRRVHKLLHLINKNQSHKRAMKNRFMRTYVITFLLNTQPPFLTRDSTKHLRCPEYHETGASLRKISKIVPCPVIDLESNPQAKALGKENAAKYNRQQSAHLTQND